MTRELLDLPVRSAIQLMSEGQVSPVELALATLEEARAADGDLSAFVTLETEGRIVEAARGSEERYRRGEALRLDGLPLPLKDTEDTQGLRTTYGSPLFSGHVPDRDGGAAAAARSAGAVIFGKTNTSSFAHMDDASNLLGLTTRNPLDLRRSPGGSSGGAAAAVAAGVCRVAHATDGAGSARLPAAFCGVVGFKPTYGRIPRWPSSDLWGGRSQHGVIGRTVDDVAMAMGGLAIYDARDPLSVWEMPDWERFLDEPPVRPLRVAYAPTLGFGELDKEISRVVSAAMDTLPLEFFSVSRVAPDIPDPALIFDRLYGPQLNYDLRDVDINSRSLDHSLVSTLKYGSQLSMGDYMRNRDERGKLYEQVVRFMEPYDLLITPSTPCEPWFLDIGPEANGKLLPPSMSARLGTLLLFNLLGWPALSVPCGFTDSGMPAGMQIAARRGADILCLKAGAVAEESFKKMIP